MLQSTEVSVKVNQEITRSFRNVNYSQWERQVSKPSLNQANPKKTGIKYSFTVSVFIYRGFQSQSESPIN